MLADAVHENETSRWVSETTAPGSQVLFFSGADKVTGPGGFMVGVGGVGGAGVGAGSPPEHPANNSAVT